MKKILLLIIFIGFGLLMSAGAQATWKQVYIGLQINQAVAPGCIDGTDQCENISIGRMTNTNWCVANGSILYVRYNSNIQYNSAITTSGSERMGYLPPATTYRTVTTEPTCAGETIWSPLFFLDDSLSNYDLELYVANGVCPGYYIGGHCFIASQPGEDCCEACLNNYGLTAERGNASYYEAAGGPACEDSDKCYDYLENYDEQAIMEILVGDTCDGSIETSATFNYFDPDAETGDTDPNTKKCNFMDWYTSQKLCGTNFTDTNSRRICECNASTSLKPTFYFSFTP